ncbi:methylated-DNA--[protein]-cysteine S-methyltransferase [Rheinheimera metallidurans]|uniref:methylated-DNA--[protein]-cysteine S-methyltransferase n=1 Tax=Rheinheimera metallidurans TaxID=2925781 RepID=UPI0030021CBD
MFTQYIDSPLGPIKIQANDKGITEIAFVSSTLSATNTSSLTKQAALQLSAYFAGELNQFNLPLDATGTVFQQQVWHALCDIPFGTTRSYGDIAQQINNIKAVRAVGGANGRNPIAIVVPCHRVIGANGTLTGYNGGLDKKTWLLKHEQRQ